MKMHQEHYGGIAYGFGNRFFWIWFHDERKSTLAPKRWVLGSVGIFGWCISGALYNLFYFHLPRSLKKLMRKLIKEKKEK